MLDADNYKSSYREKAPFKAVLIEITDYPCYVVKSTETKKIYELYYYQIKEILNQE